MIGNKFVDFIDLRFSKVRRVKFVHPEENEMRKKQSKRLNVGCLIVYTDYNLNK